MQLPGELGEDEVGRVAPLLRRLREELRAKVAGMHSPVVKVHKACYGLKRSIFAYEAGRGERLLSTGLTRVRGTRCVFKFVDSLGREAFLGVFVDDAITIGHEGAV